MLLEPLKNVQYFVELRFKLIENVNMQWIYLNPLHIRMAIIKKKCQATYPNKI